MIDRRALLLEANQAATDARERVGFDEISPIDVYDLAARLGLKVRFLAVSMEGFYQKAKPPKILLSAQRPLARRAFTCGHEIGHHWFGHGSTIDQLQEDDRSPSNQPEEILADGFASFVLMPTIGVRRAFASRSWAIETADPQQLLTVATEFGVGYRTLIAHLAFSLRKLSSDRRTVLIKQTPQMIRNTLLGGNDLSGLAIVDEFSLNRRLDLEVGYGLAIPQGLSIPGNVVEFIGNHSGFSLYRASRRGSTNMAISGRTVNVRVAPKDYVGLASFRHLEDPDE